MEETSHSREPNLHHSMDQQSKPFAAGANRYAFYMKDIDLDQKLVAKILASRWIVLAGDHEERHRESLHL